MLAIRTLYSFPVAGRLAINGLIDSYLESMKRRKELGRTEEDVYPKCGEEEQIPDHIVVPLWEGVRDERGRGRREWASENGMRWITGTLR